MSAAARALLTMLALLLLAPLPTARSACPAADTYSAAVLADAPYGYW